MQHGIKTLVQHILDVNYEGAIEFLKTNGTQQQKVIYDYHQLQGSRMGHSVLKEMVNASINDVWSQIVVGAFFGNYDEYKASLDYLANTILSDDTTSFDAKAFARVHLLTQEFSYNDFLRLLVEHW